MTRAAGHDETFRAVADASRRVLLGALAEGPKSFQDLHALLPLTKSAVSQHLAILLARGWCRSTSRPIAGGPMRWCQSRSRRSTTGSVSTVTSGPGTSTDSATRCGVTRAARPHAPRLRSAAVAAAPPAVGDAAFQSLPTSAATVAAIWLCEAGGWPAFHTPRAFHAAPRRPPTRTARPRCPCRDCSSRRPVAAPMVGHDHQRRTPREARCRLDQRPQRLQPPVEPVQVLDDPHVVLVVRPVVGLVQADPQHFRLVTHEVIHRELPGVVVVPRGVPRRQRLRPAPR